MHVKVYLSIRRIAASAGFCAFICFVTLGARVSDSSRIRIEVLRPGFSNEVFVLTDAAATNSSGLSCGGEGVAKLVESNGLYSIEIKMEAANDDVIPAGTGMPFLDIHQVLDIYAELTGADLQVDEDVRQFHGIIKLRHEVPMTRAQACQLIEAALRNQAGIEVFHSDSKHLVLKLQKKPIPMNERHDGPTSGCTEPGDSASASNVTSAAPGR